jgi:cytochrome P450
LQKYIAEMTEEYRRAPADCMLSDLAHAQDDERHLTTVEIVSMVVQILTAGNDTTTSAMSSAMYRMVTTPGLENKLRGNPEAIGNFVEEVLRYDSPVQGLWRRVTKDTRIGDTDIPEGSIVVLRFGAANHDGAQFPDPDSLQPERKNARQHLAFGTGPHFCVGNQLARAELRTSFGMLLDSLKNFRLAGTDGGVTFNAHFFGYGVTHLDIEFDRI